jgi:hypothetical protein
MPEHTPVPGESGTLYRALDLQPHAMGMEVLLAVELTAAPMPVVCLTGAEAERLYREGRLDGWKPIGPPCEQPDEGDIPAWRWGQG